MTRESTPLFSAKDASLICGPDPKSLQIMLDNDYVEATVVTQGNRTYRMFTSKQLESLGMFNELARFAVKPSRIKVHVANAHLRLGTGAFNGEPELIAFGPRGEAAVIGANATAVELKNACIGAYVLDYASLRRHIERETSASGIAARKRYMERHPEKFGD